MGQAALDGVHAGRIDSTANVLDDDRSLQLVTPHKARSSWTRLVEEAAAGRRILG